MDKDKDSNYRRGIMAEILAGGWLWLKGYRLRAWRYKTPVGEIDLVVTRGKILVFVEVKERPALDEGVAAIRPASFARLRRAAAQYLARHPRFSGYDQRFDLVAVARGGRIRHLDNIDLGSS